MSYRAFQFHSVQSKWNHDFKVPHKGISWNLKYALEAKEF